MYPYNFIHILLYLCAQRSDWLPAYDDEGIRQLLNEMTEVHQRLKEIIDLYSGERPDPVKVSIAYYMQIQQRNRRYLYR